MILREMFTKPVDRPIEGVIKADDGQQCLKDVPHLLLVPLQAWAQYLNAAPVHPVARVEVSDSSDFINVASLAHELTALCGSSCA